MRDDADARHRLLADTDVGMMMMFGTEALEELSLIYGLMGVVSWKRNQSL